jgi:sugar phosphate isomerase/epimerase
MGGALGLAGYHKVSGSTLSDIKAQIAVQLYSVRDYIQSERSAAEVFDRLSGIGYRNVETAFWPENLSVSRAGQLLRKAGLEVISAHVELPVGDERETMLKVAEAYECTRMVWHGWPMDERYRSNEGVNELTELYNECHEFASQNGLTLHLHNHWWEFERLPDESLPYYQLLEGLNADILFEIDTWWTLVAGLNPATVLKDFGPRAPLLHIKDGAVINTEGPMVAIGTGLQDFPAILSAAAADYWIVEFDSCETDMFDALASSYKYLSELSI